MASFLTSSKLKVNDDKTHTMLLSTSQMRRSRDLGMVVAIGSELSQPSEVEKLLGVQVHQNMKWGNMIMNNKKSLIQALTTRSNALAIICRLANFKTQKIIANGIWNSKLCYCLSLWGGTEGYLLLALQKMQTKVARLVCRRGRRYPASAALQAVGWLPVVSLINYYSIMQAKTVLDNKKPSYLYEKLVGGGGRPAYTTRLCVGGNLSQGPGMIAKLTLTKNSWRWRVRTMWGDVPVAIRAISGNIALFKSHLKALLWSRSDV